jgi:Tetratricopeptide repeat/CHAT domain
VLIREALQIVEQKQGKNHLEYAQRLIVLASLYEDKGQYKEALQLRTEALVTQEKLLGSEHPDIARALNGIAMNCNRVNDFMQAETCYKRSLAIAEKTVKKTHPIYFNVLANIAVLHSTLGNHEQARILSEQSLELKKIFYGEMSTNYALALGNHAVALANVSKTDKTISNSEIEPYYLKAINIYKNNLLGKEKEYAPLLENFGSYYLQYKKDYPMAEKWLLEASDVIKNKFGNTHFSYIENLSNLSELYDKMGKDSLALHYATTALTDYNKYYGKGTRNYSRVLVNLINVYRNQGIYKQAAEKSCEAIDLTIKQIRQTFTFLSEREQQKYMAFNGNLVTKFYSLAHQSPDSAFLSRICNLSLLVKGLSLQTGTQLKKGIEDSHDSTATALLDRLNALRASLGAQYQKPLEKQFRVAEMSQEAEDTEKQLMAQSSAFKTAMSGLNANWRTIQAALKPNEAAIEWVAYRYFNKDWTDTTYYAAFVIRPKATAPQFVLACSEKQIIDLLTPTAIKDKANSAIDALYSNKSSLYKTVWQSLEKYLTGCQTLYLSPMGILNRLSFAAIASPNGQPLYARYNLHTMSHLRALIDQNPTTPFPTTAALFGGIDYETASLPSVLGGIEGGVSTLVS